MEQLTALRGAVLTHTTLERAVHYWLSRQPPVDVADVVTQDEYTHDVIVQLPDGRVVVYDAT